MSGINDFVIKFATVNGSGSASANTMVAKTLFRMGIPVSPKNIFPSNIQGLPTWYEVRVSEAGYLARRDGIDLMVAMNPQTYAEDLAEVVPGGWLLYDSSMPRIWPRDDITLLPIPIAHICAKQWTDARQRQLFKNMVYVGALVELLSMDMEALKGVISDQLKGKEKLMTANLQAVQLGRDYAREHFSCPLSIHARPAEGAKGKIMVTGNDAGGLAAVYGGATVCAWYPITPSTSLAEAYEKYARRLRVTKEGKRLYGIVQAEDELAAIGVAIGGGWNGARSFTATSGPGISLMSEFLGLAYFAEVPVVLFNIQRGGPSTGMPTRTGQPDIISCAYASHGDTKHVLLFPSNPTEVFSMGAEAFDLAELLQTPIMVMSDLDIGMNDWMTDPFTWDDSREQSRGKVLSAEQLEAFKTVKGKPWGRYLDVDGDAIPYRTLPGTHPSMGSFFTRGTSHDEYARYTEDGRIHARVIDRIRRKFDTAATVVPKPEIETRDKNSKVGIIYFGATRPAVIEGLDELERTGVRLNAMRLKAFPFNEDVKAFCAAHDQIFVLEQNRDAQMRSLLITEADIPATKLIPALSYDGMPTTAAFVRKTVLAHLQPEKAAAAE
ncbi:2-oxoacid:acceptor oxidoreductase subunit alpha [Hyphomicrobium sp. CS1BSMeth3]|uniref:2-oxoacid:acceptor oxidoreductase subunit alpha n=1 Tax=Hyphomicrobium sp. CS1BSMeth3 TaxID=1892844 RepID=UPI000930591D|nr:2-oxoacid:acceptor oxidoreductase subunit alpha [Hyphomicrobium sp. CS1BSMeth3]